MDPNYKRDQPGKSPMGMDLVPVYAESSTASGVKISPEVMNNIGVQVEPVKYRSLRINIDALGVIKENDNSDKLNYTYLINDGISKFKGGIKILKDFNYPKEIINESETIINNY